MGAPEEDDVLGGRYRVLEMLGSGGRGAVYRAEDMELEVEVAVKLLQPAYTQSIEEVSRLKLEIVNARKITHQNVVRIHDLQFAEATPFISMELLLGGTLRDRLKLGPLDIADALNISLAIAEGLAAVHKEEILHRDIKPENILFSEHGIPKLVDFGIARLRSKAERTTGVIRGTPQYMSPEQFRGGALSPASDVYALGVVMYRMFTDKVPFRAKETVVLARMHTLDLPLRPRDLRKEIPEQVESIILRCLEKKPEDRYPSARQLRRELRTIQQDLGFERATDMSTVWSSVAVPPGTRRTPPEEESTTVPRDDLRPAEHGVRVAEPGSTETSIKVGVSVPPPPSRVGRVLVWVTGLIILLAFGFVIGRELTKNRGNQPMLQLPEETDTRKIRELGRVHTDDFISGRWELLVYAEEDRSKNVERVVVRSTVPKWDFQLTTPSAHDAAARAGREGRDSQRWNPAPGESRRVEYRLYQRGGQPSRFEVIVISRKSASEMHPPASLVTDWPF